MTNEIISEFVNDSHERIMDFDDTELISPNNNFDFHSFMETNNPRDNNNADLMITHQEKIEQFHNEKVLMQAHYSNKLLELQTQLVKTKNALEKSEMSKAEIEVEVTKVNKELRISQRQFHLKITEFDRSKMELTNHFKTLESEYKRQIVHLNNLDKMLQEQINEEKCINFHNQEVSTEKITQLNEKLNEKEKELSYCKNNLLSLESSVKEYQMNLFDLRQKIKTFEEKDSMNTSIIIAKEQNLESLRASECKLKTIIVDITAKVNQLESQNFEEKHELKESRSFQNNLQFQLLDLQQKQTIYEKEHQVLLDKVNQGNRRSKDLEESLNNQVKIAANYREQIKKLENDIENQENSINETNDDLQMKVEELETKLEIQSRVIEEVNDEISSSRETESVAVCNLTRTLEELERFITESSLVHLQSSRKSPQRNVPRNMEAHNLSTRKERAHVLKNTCNADQIPSSKNIINNVKNVFLSFQERINTMECERLDILSKVQSQDRELKNLKSLVRQSSSQQKSLEQNNNEKQKEIENLLQEISVIKVQTKDYKQKNDKHLSHLKETLDKTSVEYTNNIESRDHYLQSISSLIKEILSKSLNTYIDKNVMFDNQGDPSHIFNQEQNTQKCFDHQNHIENFTQTALVDKAYNKDNVELTANLTGTFRFLNDSIEKVGKSDNLQEKRVRHNPDNRKPEQQGNNNIEEIKKLSLKRSSKPENKPYVDDCESWPALREVLSTELVTLLNKYDLQRAQCHQLMSELSAKESLIARLLSNQNSCTVPLNNQVELMSRGQQTHNHASTIKKSPNKFASSNQNNVLKITPDNKKKPRVINKKVENISTNMSNKRCAKPVHSQKQCLPTAKLLTNNCEILNKKVTTMSTDRFSRQIVGPQNPSMSKSIQKKDVNIYHIQKLNVISPQSTQEVILKCPEIAENEEAIHGCCFDSRFLLLFVRTLLRLIKTDSHLQSMEDLRYFYKLCYNRSIDFSKLIAVNNDLVTLIESFGILTSQILNRKSKNARFRVVVHIITICRYMSRNVLASKLMVQIYPTDDASINYTDFFQTLLSQSAEDIASPTYVTHLIETFMQFCELNNYQHLLMDDLCRKSKTPKVMISSNITAFETLKESVTKLRLICDNQVSKVKYKSKQKLYQTNVKSLVTKIKELFHIIEGQNSLIEMREDEIIQQKESLNKDVEEKEKLMNSIRELQLLYQKELRNSETQKMRVAKMKEYLSGVFKMCEERIRGGIFNITEFMEEEEAVYLRSECGDFNTLMTSIRDCVKMVIKLSGTMKTIIV